jgi:hypothetical protein
LPDFIQLDVVSTLKDTKSKIYFYTLARKSKENKNVNE